MISNNQGKKYHAYKAYCLWASVLHDDFIDPYLREIYPTDNHMMSDSDLVAFNEEHSLSKCDTHTVRKTTEDLLVALFLFQVRHNTWSNTTFASSTRRFL